MQNANLALRNPSTLIAFQIKQYLYYRPAGSKRFLFDDSKAACWCKQNWTYLYAWKWTRKVTSDMNAFHLKSIKRNTVSFWKPPNQVMTYHFALACEARYGVTTLCEVNYVKFWQTYDGKSEHCKIISESQNLTTFPRWTQRTFLTSEVVRNYMLL